MKLQICEQPAHKLTQASSHDLLFINVRQLVDYVGRLVERYSNILEDVHKFRGDGFIHWRSSKKRSTTFNEAMD
jgi:hypothetical protein